ncbi:MAG: hypothetical protein KDJ23_17500 [Rhodoblastus sp.]|nr:hypothetical protein [Rhodoblastus sp.]MCC0000365.1 hypothetical protein [Methylobacteriaceae bacterium]
MTKGDIEAVVEIAEAFPTKVFPEAVGIKYPDPKVLIDFGAIVFNAIGPDNDLRTRSMARNKDVMPLDSRALLARAADDGRNRRDHLRSRRCGRNLRARGGNAGAIVVIGRRGHDGDGNRQCTVVLIGPH